MKNNRFSVNTQISEITKKPVINSKKTLSALILVIFIFLSFASMILVVSASGNIIYVDDDADPSWYNETHVKTIQEGINNASEGDTIFVYNGTYNENVGIYKTVTIIGNESGNCIVQSSNPNLDVFSITADWVNLSGFTIKNANGTNNNVRGIYVNGADHCKISDIIITNITTSYNATSDILAYGMMLRDANDITVASITISNITGNDSSAYGIQLGANAHNNTFTDIEIKNIIANKTGNGISIGSNSDNNTLSKISVENIAANNTAYGIWISNSKDNIFTNSTICNLSGNITSYGIFVSNSSNNICLGTSISENEHGIYLQSSNNNTIYNNYFNNTNNTYDDGNNTWNTTKTLGTNIINGHYLGGNYWSNYTGEDTDGDGLGNTPYNISGGENKDNHPLVENRPPTAHIDSITPNPATEEQAVTFSGHGNDPDGGTITNYNWRSSIDGPLNTQASFSTSTLSTGTHIIYFKVQDNNNEWSDEVSGTLVINPGEEEEEEEEEENLPPTSNAGGPYEWYAGIELTFDGSGSTDTDGIITSYAWIFGDGTTGGGVKPTHTYTEIKEYTVTLTVTDDGGATDTDTTTAIITAKPNNPPNPPVVNGTTTGKINIKYNYTANATDPDDDNIRYIFNWSDGTNDTISGFLPNGTIFNTNHTWTTKGIYTLKVYAEDEYNATSGTTKIMVFIDVDVEFIDDVIKGYLIDDNKDGIYDSYHNNETGNETTVELQDDGNYSIDSDGDGSWDYTYDPAAGTITSFKEEEPEPEEKIEEFPYTILAVIIIAFIIIALIIYLYKKEYF